MSKKNIITLIFASCLVIMGAAMTISVLAVKGWDLSALSTDAFVTTTHEITEDFDSISVSSDTEDIIFLRSKDETCKVVCFEKESISYKVGAENGRLSIIRNDQREWFEHIGVSFSTPKITVYLPKTEYASLSIDESTGRVEVPKGLLFQSVKISLSTGNVSFAASASGVVSIDSSTGSIEVKDASVGGLKLSTATGQIKVAKVVSAGDVDVDVSTGSVLLTDLHCKSLSSVGNTGGLTLCRVMAEERFDLERDTGSIKFESCDAEEITADTDTGDISGSLLSDKIFIASSDTGTVRVPSTEKGGLCKLTSDTGSIIIVMEK